jgi:hypothetical protein
MYFPLNKDEEPEFYLIDHSQRLASQEPEFGPYTFAALHDAFELVRNPKDWKAPVNGLILEGLADVVYHAIVFFTATEPIFLRPPRDPNLLLVHADGYRAGPAGP